MAGGWEVSGKPKPEWSVPKAIEETPGGQGYNMFTGEYNQQPPDPWSRIRKTVKDEDQSMYTPSRYPWDYKLYTGEWDMEKLVRDYGENGAKKMIEWWESETEGDTLDAARKRLSEAMSALGGSGK